MGDVAGTIDHVKEFTVTRGNDRGTYVNAFFTLPAKHMPALWSLLRKATISHRSRGAALRRSSIVVCEGSRGWDNYLLLHHFQVGLGVDQLPDV